MSNRLFYTLATAGALIVFFVPFPENVQYMLFGAWLSGLVVWTWRAREER